MVIPGMNMNSTTMKHRRTVDGEVIEREIEAVDLHDDGLTFSVDADVLEGDIISYTLPNGHEKVMTLTKVRVLQSPFPGAGGLDHTSAAYVVGNERLVRQPQKVTLPGMHPAISAASGAAFASGHFGNAVFDAFVAVEDRVQTLAREPKLSGRSLMAAVFNEQAPKLDTATDDANERQAADQREGFKFLFMGASAALRNPQGHGGKIALDEQEAIEALALASLLMRALDRADVRHNQSASE